MNRYGIIILCAATCALLSGCAIPVYFEDERDPLFFRTGYGVQASPEVGSPGWARACARRFPNFDEDSGTFVAENGLRRYCVI